MVGVAPHQVFIRLPFQQDTPIPPSSSCDVAAPVRAQVVILAVSFLGIAAAWTFSVQLMTLWVMLALIIAILGASTTLSPVIVLRLVFIVLGFQVQHVFQL